MSGGISLRDVIYLLTDPGIPAFGGKGASVHVQAVLRELHARARAAGGRTILVTSRLGGPVPPGLEGIEIVRLPRARATSPAAREQELMALDRHAAGVAAALVARCRHYCGPDDPAPVAYQRYALFSAAAITAAGGAGAQTILEVNAPLVTEQAEHRDLCDAEAATAMSRAALRAAGSVVAVSSPVADWAADLSGRPVRVVPNGVDLLRYRAVRARDTREPVVAFAGGFRPWHGTDQLVRAAARTARRGHPVRLLLIGDGPCLPGVLALARQYRLPVTACGQVAPGLVPAHLAGADIAAAPYPAGDAYFSPLKVAEYLAAGLPSVISAVADLPVLLRPGEAHLVRPGDEDAFTAALTALAADPLARARMGRAARAAAARFSWASVVDRILAAGPERTAPARLAGAGR